MPENISTETESYVKISSRVSGTPAVEVKIFDMNPEQALEKSLTLFEEATQRTQKYGTETDVDSTR